MDLVSELNLMMMMMIVIMIMNALCLMTWRLPYF